MANSLTCELTALVQRELELAPLAGRYFDERASGVRAVGQFDDLLLDCRDVDTAAEAADVFGMIDVILNLAPERAGAG